MRPVNNPPRGHRFYYNNTQKICRKQLFSAQFSNNFYVFLLLIINNLQAFVETIGRGSSPGSLRRFLGPQIHHRIGYLLPVCDPVPSAFPWPWWLGRTTHRIGGIKPFQDLRRNPQHIVVLWLDEHKAVFLPQVQTIQRKAIVLALVAILYVAGEPIVWDLEDAVLGIDGSVPDETGKYLRWC